MERSTGLGKEWRENAPIPSPNLLATFQERCLSDKSPGRQLAAATWIPGTAIEENGGEPLHCKRMMAT
jgi:hypothetical protein